jgi:hypothetical protein
MQELWGHWQLPPRFQRKAWEARQKFAAGLESPQRDPSGVIPGGGLGVGTPDRQSKQPVYLDSLRKVYKSLCSLRVATGTTTIKTVGQKLFEALRTHPSPQCTQTPGLHVWAGGFLGWGFSLGPLLLSLCLLER